MSIIDKLDKKISNKKKDTQDKEKAYDYLTELFQKEILLLGALD